MKKFLFLSIFLFGLSFAHSSFAVFNIAPPTSTDATSFTYDGASMSDCGTYGNTSYLYYLGGSTSTPYDSGCFSQPNTVDNTFATFSGSSPFGVYAMIISPDSSGDPCNGQPYETCQGAGYEQANFEYLGVVPSSSPSSTDPTDIEAIYRDFFFCLISGMVLGTIFVFLLPILRKGRKIKNHIL